MKKCKIRIFIAQEKWQQEFRDTLELYGFQFYIFDPVLNQHRAEKSGGPDNSTSLYECIYNGKVPSRTLFKCLIKYNKIFKSLKIEME